MPEKINANQKIMINLIIFLVGVIITIWSSNGISVNFIPLEYQFGLLQVLPPIFFVGLSLILFSVIIGTRYDSEKLFLTKLFFLFVLIWYIPSLFVSNPVVGDTYYHFHEHAQISTSGHIPPITWAYGSNNPGFYLDFSFLTILATPPTMIFLKLYPLFSSAITFLAIVVFCKTYIRSSSYRYAVLLIVVACVYFQFHFSPYSVAFFIGLLLLSTLEHEEIIWKLVAILFFIFIVISSPTTVMFILPIVIVRPIVGKIIYPRSYLPRLNKYRSVVLLFLVIWLGWLFFWSIYYSKLIVSSFYQTLLRIFSYSEITQSTSYAFTGKASYYIPNVIRTVVLFAFTIIAVLYILRENRRKKDGYINENLHSFITFMVIPFILTGVDILYLPFAMVYDRFFLFLIVAGCVLSIRFFFDETDHTSGEVFVRNKQKRKLRNSINKYKSKLLCVMLMLSILNLTTIYYQHSLYVIDDETIAGSDFAVTKLSSHTKIGGVVPDVWNYPQMHRVYGIPLILSQHYPNSFENISAWHGTYYVIFSKHEMLWYLRYGLMDKYDYYYSRRGNLEKFYTNGEFEIYMFISKWEK